MRRAPILVILLGTLNYGGACGPGFEDPCDDDRTGCQASTGLGPEVECAPEPTLALELGTGGRAFEALAPDEVPTLHYGNQGGVHIFASVRVRGAQLDRYDLLEFEFWLERRLPDCEAAAEAMCWSAAENRTALLGGPSPLNVVDGVVEEPGFVLFADELDYAPGPWRLRATVRDPCRREASAEHRMLTEG